MIPKIYVKEHGYPAFAPFGIAPIPAGMVRPDLMPDGPAMIPNVIEIPPNANIESILQVHRRKMLRRAANRRSAQLSRARKKAHLEELKAENTRLQRLVDNVSDSQPELIFCITSTGKVTYISDRMLNFVKIMYAPEDNSDEDPTHINQLLVSESANDVIDSINKLRECSNPSSDDLTLLFSAKEVYFYDSFGNKLIGYLRCSKVHRRSSLQDLQFSEALDKPSNSNNSNTSNNNSSSIQPPTKKAKLSSSKNSSEKSSQGNSSQDINNAANGNNGGWNLSNFNMLADCALNEEAAAEASMQLSSLSNSTSNDKNEKDKKSSESGSSNSGNNSGENASNDGQDISRSESSSSNNINYYDAEDEYVCVIRTNNKHFAQYRKDVNDVLLFSSAAILSTSSMQAHNNTNNIIINNTKNTGRGGGGISPNGSEESNNSSSDVAKSSKANTTSASSETASEDNNDGEVMNSDQSSS